VTSLITFEQARNPVAARSIQIGLRLFHSQRVQSSSRICWWSLLPTPNRRGY